MLSLMNTTIMDFHSINTIYYNKKFKENFVKKGWLLENVSENTYIIRLIKFLVS